MSTLCCPHCGGPSFELQIQGYQEKATLELRDGKVICATAGPVRVEDHNEETIVCESCSEVLSQDDLVDY